MVTKMKNSTYCKDFCTYLKQEEKSRNTIEKYERDAKAFLAYLDRQEIELAELQKSAVVDYKQKLLETYQPASVNSILAGVHAFLDYMGHGKCKVKPVRIQPQTFIEERRSMSKNEYCRLLTAAKEMGKTRLGMIMETLCGTGIRVGELKYFTVDAVRTGYIRVMNKGKSRIIFIPKELRHKLLEYCRRQDIKTGHIFSTRSGRPIDRSNLWREIRLVCKKANVDVSKGFPHNFRHLFAKIFYGVKKDVIKLAVLLGHSSLETTRIYAMPSFSEFFKQLDHMKLGLIS